jgi:hypothetical protein
MTVKNVEKDTVIFEQGDVADTAYFVVSGKVTLYQTDRSQLNVLRSAGENEVFGELALFDASALRPYSAKTLEATILQPFPREDLTTFVNNAGKPIQALFALITERMKLGKVKTLSKKEMALSTTIKSITVKAEGDRIKTPPKPATVPVANLPFRVGGYPEDGESNKRDTVHMPIPSQASPLRVSRQHCEIAIEDGVVVVIDLGSRFGTTVNGTTIGRGRGTYSFPLKNGSNIIMLGGADSGYQLVVTCE